MSDEDEITPEVDDRPTNPWSGLQADGDADASDAPDADAGLPPSAAFAPEEATAPPEPEPVSAPGPEPIRLPDAPGPDEIVVGAAPADPLDEERQPTPIAPSARAPRRVRAVDFRRPTKFSRDQMRRLEAAHDGFCRGASTRLSAELRTGVEIVVTTSDQLSYAAVMGELPEEAIVTILDVDPIDTQVALIFELPLAVNLIDRLLGAVIARKTMPTGLTDLEAVVLQRVIRSIVEPLSATWFDLAGVRFSIAVAASTPANAQFAAPSEPCLLLSGEAHIDGASSPIVFCLPHASVEPLMERLEKAHVRGRAVDERATAMLRQAVSGVDVELRAEVGAVELDMSDVLALRPGDMLPLRASAADGVTILAGDVPSYMAAPGRNNAARAIQITGPYREGPQ